MAAVAGFGLLAGVATADRIDAERVHVLEEIVVTSTSKSNLIDTPASISVITAADLEQMGAKNIIEALERIPGVYNTSAADTSLSIRGTRSSMAGGPVILVDGVAQKYGNYRREELDIIPVSQIERIEVLRSAGVAYGPGAARGVINIITKKGRDREAVTGHLAGSYGSWNTVNLSGSLGGRIDSWDYYADIAHYATDGYEEEDEYRTAGLIKLGCNLSALTRVGVRGNWVTLDQDRAYGLGKYDWHLAGFRRSIHFPRSETDDRLVWHNRQEQSSGAYAAELTHRGARMFIDGYVSYTHYTEMYHDTKDIFYSTARTRGKVDDRRQDTYTAALSGGYVLTAGRLGYIPTFGINYENIDFKQRRAYPYDTAGTASTLDYDLDLAEEGHGAFWDNDFAWGEHWGLKVGGRIDTVSLTFENQTPWRLDSEETRWSWVVAPSYHLSPDANVYCSISRNHWFPSPQYYFWAADYGSADNLPEDLKPEESTTYEIGYKHRLHRALNMAMTAYYAKTADKFAGYYEGDSYMGQKNTGDADAYGLELEVDGRPLEGFGYRLAAAYIQAEWKSGAARIYDHPGNVRVVVDLDGYKVYGIPEFNGRIGLDFYPMQGLRASLDANIWGKYYLDYTNRLTYPSKTTIDASVAYAWSKYKLWVLCKNLFDEKIERAINSTGQLTAPGGNSATAYYVQDGIYLEAGLAINF
jgi:iron complex outermembrane recepter protein